MWSITWGHLDRHSVQKIEFTTWGDALQFMCALASNKKVQGIKYARV